MVARKRKVPRTVQPESNEESGSAGRNTEADNLGRDKDAGQDRYGQSATGEANYSKPAPDGESGSKSESNEGSGLVEHEEEELNGANRRG